MSSYGYEVVIFDVETTGFHRDSEICQIAACTDDSDFDTYVLPSAPFNYRATQVNGMELENDGNMNYLTHHGRRVNARTPRNAMIKFLEYLDGFDRPVILLAHNAFSFDMPRILDLANEVNMYGDFENSVELFADSLKMAYKLLPDRFEEQRRFTVKALACDYLDDVDLSGLHNAANDVEILRQLLPCIGVTDRTIMDNARRY